MDNFIDKLAQKFTAGEVIKANSAAEERELKRLREQVAEYEKCLQEMRKIQMTNTQTAQQLHDLMVESTEVIRKLTADSKETFQNFTTDSTETFRKFTSDSSEAFQKFAVENTDTFQKLTAESTDTIQKLTAESIAKISDIQLETDVQKAEAKKSVEIAAMTMEQMQDKVVRMQETVAELTAALEKNQKEVAEWFKQADDFLHKENVKVYRNVQAVVVEEVGNKAETIMKAQEDTVKKSNKTVLIFAVLGFVAAAASFVTQLLDVMGMLKF